MLTSLIIIISAQDLEDKQIIKIPNQIVIKLAMSTIEITLIGVRVLRVEIDEQTRGLMHFDGQLRDMMIICKAMQSRDQTIWPRYEVRAVLDLRLRIRED